MINRWITVSKMYVYAFRLCVLVLPKHISEHQN